MDKLSDEACSSAEATRTAGLSNRHVLRPPPGLPALPTATPSVESLPRIELICSDCYRPFMAFEDGKLAEEKQAPKSALPGARPTTFKTPHFAVPPEKLSVEFRKFRTDTSEPAADLRDSDLKKTEVFSCLGCRQDLGCTVDLSERRAWKPPYPCLVRIKLLKDRKMAAKKFGEDEAEIPFSLMYTDQDGDIAVCREPSRSSVKFSAAEILKLPVDEIKRWIDEAPQYRLLVENVPYSISRDSATLKKAFEEDSEEFGADSIARVRVLLKTGKDKIEPRGMAYIMFRNKPAFEAALARDYTDLSKKYGDGSRPDKPAGRVWTVRPTPARPAKDSKPPRSRAACGAGAGAEDSTGSEAEEATAAEGK